MRAHADFESCGDTFERRADRTRRKLCVHRWKAGTAEAWFEGGGGTFKRRLADTSRNRCGPCSRRVGAADAEAEALHLEGAQLRAELAEARAQPNRLPVQYRGVVPFALSQVHPDRHGSDERAV
jgi:hypothetical protein